MILCVTPNPGVEHTVTIPNFRLGAVNRTRGVMAYVGGKGFNASRTIRMLEGDYLNLSIAGRHAGEWAKEMLSQEGLHGEWTSIDHPIRFVMIVVDPSATSASTALNAPVLDTPVLDTPVLDTPVLDATVINEEGPTLSQAEWTRFTSDVQQHTHGAYAIALAGSLPGDTPAAWLAEMVATLKQSPAQVWIDNRGAALEAALPQQPHGVKFNGKEAATLLDGREIDSVTAALAAANAFRQRGIANVNITLGELGAVLVNNEGGWHVRPPRYQPVNSAGSGDAFFGGLLHGLDRGESMGEALRMAAAAGAANALTALAGQVYAADYQRALQATMVERVS